MTYADLLLSSASTEFLVGLGIFIILLAIGFYVYYALAWMTIGKKLKHLQDWNELFLIMRLMIVPLQELVYWI